MASQYRGGEEDEEWKVVSMCGLYRFEQGLPKRPIPYASDRSVNGCNCRPSLNKLLRCLSRIPLNTISFG